MTLIMVPTSALTALLFHLPFFSSLAVCCAVLCCAVLCCAVLCCAVLCCAVLCCAVLCCSMRLCCVCRCLELNSFIKQGE